MDHRWRWLFDPRTLLIIGIIIGIGIGMYYGWEIQPVDIIDTDIYDLRADHQDDFIVMVGALYTLERDETATRQLLGLLNQAKIENVVVDVGERYIAQGTSANDIHYLVNLAEMLRVVTGPMRPFLETP